MNKVVIIAGFALFASLFAEYFLGAVPCSLCLVQRGLYALLFVVAISRLRKCVFVLLSALFLVASYHTLVQLKIVEDRCKINKVTNLASYKEQLGKPGCSENKWIVPVPAINAGVALVLLVLLRFDCPRKQLK